MCTVRKGRNCRVMTPRLPTRYRMQRSSLLWVLAAGVAMCIAGSYRQERAQIIYFNSKYIKDAQAFTGRQRRGDPYKTNVTATLIRPWANNVTVEISYKAKEMPIPLTISVRICDVLKLKWMVDFIRAYSSVKITCPLEAGTYHINNIELPPRNFPLPIPKGDVRVNMTHYITDTKEPVMHTTLVVHTT